MSYEYIKGGYFAGDNVSGYFEDREIKSKDPKYKKKIVKSFDYKGFKVDIEQRKLKNKTIDYKYYIDGSERSNVFIFVKSKYYMPITTIKDAIKEAKRAIDYWIKKWGFKKYKENLQFQGIRR